MAQWIAHWTSRHVVRDIQRLWVRVPPESVFEIFRDISHQTRSAFRLEFDESHMKKGESLLQSLWRNRLARSAVNREDGGSSPPRDGSFDLPNNNDIVSRQICPIFHPEVAKHCIFPPNWLRSAPKVWSRNKCHSFTSPMATSVNSKQRRPTIIIPHLVETCARKSTASSSSFFCCRNTKKKSSAAGAVA